MSRYKSWSCVAHERSAREAESAWACSKAPVFVAVVVKPIHGLEAGREVLVKAATCRKHGHTEPQPIVAIKTGPESQGYFLLEKYICKEYLKITKKSS